ncbi:MAG: hypothetical protein HY217_05430 [Candidatus Rokubacteria bacterium]|nr:hypothetical protein [Candidatus Rokubacteria bacterium]
MHDKTKNSSGGTNTVVGINDDEERTLYPLEPAPWSSYPGDTRAASLSWNARRPRGS